MAFYAYVCDAGHETLRQFAMRATHPRAVCCEDCGGIAVRVVGNFHFQEDRTRQFRNPVDGSTFSYSLGCEMPDTREAYHRLLDDKGCEPVTPGTEPESWKANREYLAHIQAGGDRDRAFEAAPSAPPPKSTTVLEQMRKSDFRVPS